MKTTSELDATEGAAAGGAVLLEEADMVNLGSVDRIPPGEGRAYRVGDLEIAVFRTRDGGLFAAQAACPHAGGPLADGLVGGGRVICPLHGHSFDLRSGASLRESCPNLRTFRVASSPAGDILLAPGTPQR